MAKRDARGPERMPGSPSERPAGMADYIVILKEDDEGDEMKEGRHAFYQAGVARNSHFQNRLRSFLEQRGLADQVAFIGEPTVFPLVALRCMPEVADLIGTLPEVQEVVRDADSLTTLA